MGEDIGSHILAQVEVYGCFHFQYSREAFKSQRDVALEVSSEARCEMRLGLVCYSSVIRTFGIEWETH